MADTEAPRRGSRIPWLVGLIALFVVAVATLFLWFGRGDDLPDGVYFQDDFSEVGEYWSLDSYQGITTTVEDGRYRVLLERPDRSAHDSVTFDEGIEHDGVRVSAVASFDTAPGGSVVGLTCGYAPGDADSITGLFGRYQAEIAVDGWARIVRILNADEVVLEQKEAGAALTEEGPNELSLTCDNDGSVALGVDGETALEVKDDDPFETFESAGMYAAAAEPGLDVWFDDLQAEELD